LFALIIAAAAVVGGVVGYQLAPAQPESDGAAAPSPTTGGDAAPLTRLARGALEQTMVHGDPLAAPQLMKKLRMRVPRADLAIYDSRGVEAFGPAPRAPHPRDMRPQLVAALTDHQRHDSPDGTVFRPLLSDDTCTACHDDHAEVRGVLSLETAGSCDGASGRAAIARLVDDTRAQLDAAGVDALATGFTNALPPTDDDVTACPQVRLEQTIETAFLYLMRAHQGRRAYQLLDAAVDSGVLARGALFDAAGRTIYDTTREPPPERVTRALAGDIVTDRGDGDRPRVTLPLPGGKECARCHGDAEIVGAISATVP